MSIASQIARLQSAKTAIRNALLAKGITVPAEDEYIGGRLSDYAGYIAQIAGGSPQNFKTGRFTLTDEVKSSRTIVTLEDLGFLNNGTYEAPGLFVLKLITEPSEDQYTFHAAALVATSFDTSVKAVLRKSTSSMSATASTAAITASTSMHLRITTTAVIFTAASTCILKPGTYEWYAVAKESPTP